MKKRSEVQKHLSRQQLLQAARDVTRKFDHLETCPDCRQEVLLLREFYVAGNPPLQDAPVILRNRAVAVGAEGAVAEGSKKRMTDIIFDSWFMPHPVGVRGPASRDHRYIRLDAGNISIDLRAEQLKDEWDFTARVNGCEQTDTPPRLKAGAKRITPNTDGLYVWKSKRPPKTLILQIGGTVIELPELSWKKPRST